VQDVPEPGPELDQKRPVEAEALANTFNVFGGRLVTAIITAGSPGAM
jgi:hypothetical protein